MLWSVFSRQYASSISSRTWLLTDHQQERLSRTPTAREDRRLTTPSLSLRQRYSSALASRQQPPSEYRHEKAISRQILRDHDIRTIERVLSKRLSSPLLSPTEIVKPCNQSAAPEVPQVKVKVSARSVSIIIPKGIELPIVATIQPAGSFEAQMFGGKSGDGGEASGATGDEIPIQNSRQASLSRQPSGTVVREGEDQEIIAGLGLPFLARVSKGRLNVSEASNPAPQSSEVSAQGQIFIPAHQHPNEWEPETVETPARNADRILEQSEPQKRLDSELPSAGLNGPAATDRGDTQDTQTDERVIQQPLSNGTEFVAESSAQVLPNAERVASVSSSKSAPEGSGFVPDIKVHRPSATVRVTSPGERAMDSTTNPSASVPAAPPPTPAVAPTTPRENKSDPLPTAMVPTEIPVDQTAVTSTVSVDAITAPNAGRAESTPSAVPDQPPSPPSLPSRGGVGRRKRVVLRTRSILVRKHILDVVIGRELASEVRPRLEQLAEENTARPSQMDGPSDFLSAYSRRRERKRDVQRKRVEGKIAAARRHAEAEELQKCPNCGGFVTTR